MCFGPLRVGAVSGKVEPNYILLVSYDDQGVINKYETVRYTFDFFQKTVNERALQWAGKGGSLGKFTSVSPPAGKSVVYVFRSFNPEGSHVDHIDGVFLDGNLWAELKSGQYTPIVVSSGCHTIGFERDIRKTDKFLHPDRPKTEPALTTTIDTLPNQAYFLEIFFVGIDTKPTAIFSRLSRCSLAKVGRFKKSQVSSSNLDPDNTAIPSSFNPFGAESAFANRAPYYC